MECVICAISNYSGVPNILPSYRSTTWVRFTLFQLRERWLHEENPVRRGLAFNQISLSSQEKATAELERGGRSALRRSEEGICDTSLHFGPSRWLGTGRRHSTTNILSEVVSIQHQQRNIRSSSPGCPCTASSAFLSHSHIVNPVLRSFLGVPKSMISPH